MPLPSFPLHLVPPEGINFHEISPLPTTEDGLHPAYELIHRQLLENPTITENNGDRVLRINAILGKERKWRLFVATQRIDTYEQHRAEASDRGTLPTIVGAMLVAETIPFYPEMKYFAVNPTARLKGIGTGLFLHAEKSLVSSGALIIGVDSPTQQGEKLYERYGYIAHKSEMGRTISMTKKLP